MYFFNQSRGMQVDFSIAFHLVPMPDFTNVFFVMTVVSQHEKYLVKEPELDI
jgi:hypothetical protein